MGINETTVQVLKEILRRTLSIETLWKEAHDCLQSEEAFFLE